MAEAESPELPKVPPRSKAAEEALLEEGQLDAYMDFDPASLSTNERLIYLKKRLAEVNYEYKQLSLAKLEFEKSGKTQALAQIRVGFADNFKSRKYVVTELRAMGETVTDPFIKA